MRRHKESDYDLTHVFTVRELTRLDDMLLRVTVLVKPMIGPRVEMHFEVNSFNMVRVQRMAPCGKPVCESHLQARGPGVYVCQDHYLDWEKIA